MRINNFFSALKKDKLALLSLFYLLFAVFVSIVVQWIPIDPDRLDVIHALASPSPAHFFGTDEVGRDYFIRVLYGGRVSLLVGFLSMLMSMSIGVVLGLFSGTLVILGNLLSDILYALADPRIAF